METPFTQSQRTLNVRVKAERAREILPCLSIQTVAVVKLGRSGDRFGAYLYVDWANLLLGSQADAIK